MQRQIRHTILLIPLPEISYCNRYDHEPWNPVAFSFAQMLGKNLQPVAKCTCLTPRRMPELNGELRLAAQEPADPDAADVLRVLDGDVQAFAGIVQRWQGPLVNMAWRYCRDRSRAEEMAQEAFLRAWRGLGQWRRESSFSTWLFALAANCFRNELKRFPTVSVPFEEVAEPSGAATQHDDFAAKTSRDEIRRAVLTLPRRYREPVILFYFHEMDVGAAARTMGLREGTVKARLSRARDLLKKRFPHLSRLSSASKFAPEGAGKEAQ
jgi:RNA polymerase sigma-70 factor (ECF subfamily)